MQIYKQKSKTKQQCFELIKICKILKFDIKYNNILCFQTILF